jgi:C1A family cysteine protease
MLARVCASLVFVLLIIPFRYRSGVLSAPKCYKGSVDHAVLAVGYGTEGNTDYWFVKNSWTSQWGEKGYIRMKRGPEGGKAGTCGILVDSSYAVLK